MAEYYRHRQVGYLTIVALAATLILLAVLLYLVEFNWAALVVGGILFVCFLLFWSQTVVVDEDTLQIHFGSGMARKKISLEDIKSCRRVKSSWYYGWGIRWIPHGWLFSVSGLQAVEIVMDTGKRYWIGTDEPEALENAIRRSIERTRK